MQPKSIKSSKLKHADYKKYEIIGNQDQIVEEEIKSEGTDPNEIEIDLFATS